MTLLAATDPVIEPWVAILVGPGAGAAIALFFGRLGFRQCDAKDLIIARQAAEIAALYQQQIDREREFANQFGPLLDRTASSLRATVPQIDRALTKARQPPATPDTPTPASEDDIREVLQRLERLLDR